MWATIAQVISFSIVMLAEADQDNIVYLIIFLRKDDYVNRANIAPVTSLYNVVSAVFEQHWPSCGLWANIFCIVWIIVLCNVGQSSPRQHCVGFFSCNNHVCGLRANTAQALFLFNVISNVFEQHCVEPALRG